MGYMVIGVTGGCGYVGSALLPKLDRIASAVDFIDIKKPSPALLANLNPKKFRYLPIDVADKATFSEVASRYDVIVHFAALVGYPACMKDPELAVRSNVETTENVMRFKRKDARVLFSSTISNYGAHSGQVDETTPTQPNSIYGTTKTQAENWVLSGPENIVFRFAGAFGVAPVMRNDNLIHDFVGRAVAGETLSIYESHFVRQFVHVEDMVGAVVHTIQNWDRMQGNIYNVGNPEIEITKRQLVETIAELYDFEFKFENSGTDAEKRNYPVSFQKLMKTGFKPKMALRPAVEELIRYYQLCNAQGVSHVG